MEVPACLGTEAHFRSSSGEAVMLTIPACQKWLRVALRLLAPAAAILCATPYCVAQGVDCPKTITVTEQIASLPGGWNSGQEALPHRFASITFFDGPPSESVSLPSDQQTTSGESRTDTWHFTGSRG